MKQKPHNPPAFVSQMPIPQKIGPPKLIINLGMSMRDYFAAKVVQTLAKDIYANLDQLAEEAYNIADAMLRRREKYNLEESPEPPKSSLLKITK